MKNSNEKYYTLSFFDRIKVGLCSLFYEKERLERKLYSCAVPHLEKIENPRVVMVLLVKNEEDVIEHNIRFHRAMGIDGIIVTDNASTDSTRELLEKLKNEGIVDEIIDEPSSEFNQVEFVDRMLKLAINKYKADYVISADADEFWLPSNRDFKVLLKEYAGSILHIPIYNMIDENENYIDNIRKVKNSIPDKVLRHLVKDKRLSPYNQFGKQIPKIIIRASEYIKIDSGNHGASVKRPHRKILSDGVQIYHYSSRGVEHFKRKFIEGGEALIREKTLSKNVGVHWRYFFNEFKNGRSVEDLYDSFRGKRCLGELTRYLTQDKTIRDLYYLNSIRNSFPMIMSFNEMLTKIKGGYSLIRFGDAEFDIAFVHKNKDDPYQKASSLLTKRLSSILSSDYKNIIVSIPPFNSEYNNIKNFNGEIFSFWEWYWLARWDTISKYLSKKSYGNSFFSRDAVFYYLKIEDIKEIWEGRNVVFVRSKSGRFIFDDRIFGNIKNRFDVLIPATNAFEDYDRILQECKQYPKDYLFFVAAGPTACVLVEDLVKEGYQALDMGHFSNCYLQYLGESPAPESLPLDKNKVRKKK